MLRATAVDSTILLCLPWLQVIGVITIAAVVVDCLSNSKLVSGQTDISDKEPYQKNNASPF